MTWWKNLSPREGEVALLVARGLSNKEVARELGISGGTVKISHPQHFPEIGHKEPVQSRHPSGLDDDPPRNC